MYSFIEYKKKIIFLIASFLLLFLSFQYNTFNAANMGWFQSFQHDSEALVTGRLAESKVNGIFSYKGRMGYVTVHPLKQNNTIYDGDRNNGGKQVYFSPNLQYQYHLYNSQFGIQGLFFSLMDKLLNFLHISPKISLKIFHILTSLLLAIVLTGILYVFYSQFGLFPASITLIGILSSEWLIVFGKNLYWVSGLWFLPMLAVLLFLHIEKKKIPISWVTIAVISFLTIFLKSLAGYEYISTILIAMITPIIYYAISMQWTWKKYIKRTLLIGISGLFGFISAFMVHIVQLFLVTNDISKAFTLIYQRITIRTFTDVSSLDASSVYMPSAKAEIFTVLKKYLEGHFFHGNFYFIYLILLIVLVSIISIYIIKKINIPIENKRSLSALLYTTWFSISAPISWYILAKGHSFIHTGMNYVLWYLPFMIYGFALVGITLDLLSKTIYKKNKYIPISIILIILLLLSGNYILTIKESNKKLFNLFKKEKLFEINIDKNVRLIMTNDNKLIYYISDCQSKDISGRFFLHIYPENNKVLKNKKYSFNNDDFDWNQYAIETSRYSHYSDTCIAVRELPKYKITTIHTGRYSGSKRFWQEHIEIESHVKTTDTIISFNLTDTNWRNGISKTKTGFFIENTVSNRYSLRENNILKFPFSGERKITSITISSKYINIDVNGTKLDFEKDGFPNKIRILGSEKE